jgi:cell division protein FtsN
MGAVEIDGLRVTADPFRERDKQHQELIRQIRARASTPLDDPGVMTALAATEPLPIEQVPTVAPPAPEPPHIPASVREPEPAQSARVAVVLPSAPSPPMPVPHESSRRPSSASREPLVREDAPPVAIPEKPAARVDVRPTAHLVVTRETDPRPAQSKVASLAAGRVYWVQVGAFKELGGAVRLAEELEGLGLHGPARRTVILDKTSATMLTRVRVGPFPERSEAMAQLHVLEARGYKPFVAADRD